MSSLGGRLGAALPGASNRRCWILGQLHQHAPPQSGWSGMWRVSCSMTSTQTDQEPVAPARESAQAHCSRAPSETCQPRGGGPYYLLGVLGFCSKLFSSTFLQVSLPSTCPEHLGMGVLGHVK